MSAVIKKFYEDNKIPGILLKKKLESFDKNPDIAAEFEYWIEHKTYKEAGAVSVEGYTAKKLSEESEYLNGEGAFAMLVELRENPKKALAQIAKGYKRK
ncbi:MAG: hypothetical protein J6I76_09715 [Oribacterium sp.]|nr:hypothetical protein [Oribacterium sp.]